MSAPLAQDHALFYFVRPVCSRSNASKNRPSTSPAYPGRPSEVRTFTPAYLSIRDYVSGTHRARTIDDIPIVFDPPLRQPRARANEEWKTGRWDGICLVPVKPVPLPKHARHRLQSFPSLGRSDDRSFLRSFSRSFVRAIKTPPSISSSKHAQSPFPLPFPFPFPYSFPFPYPFTHSHSRPLASPARSAESFLQRPEETHRSPGIPHCHTPHSNRHVNHSNAFLGDRFHRGEQARPGRKERPIENGSDALLPPSPSPSPPLNLHPFNDAHHPDLANLHNPPIPPILLSPPSSLLLTHVPEHPRSQRPALPDPEHRPRAGRQD